MSTKPTKQKSQNGHLLAHPLALSVLKNAHRAMKPITRQAIDVQESKEKMQGRASPKGKQGKAIKQPALTSEQEYCLDAFECLKNITSAIERLEEVPLYLKRFPNSSAFRKAGITRDKWVHYHYSNYLVIAVGAYDTALLLTNAVFMLGLEPEQCNNSTVKENRRVKRTAVKSSLEAMRRITDKYRKPRHLYVHRSKIPSLELLDTLESDRFIQEMSDKLDLSFEPTIHPVILADLYRFELRKLVANLRSGTAEIVDVTRELFDSLQPIYLALIESYGKLKSTTDHE